MRKPSCPALLKSHLIVSRYSRLPQLEKWGKQQSDTSTTNKISNAEEIGKIMNQFLCLNPVANERINVGPRIIYRPNVFGIFKFCVCIGLLIFFK
jgi:hypothetical protein